MERYNVETHDHYDMEPATDGMLVLNDDAQLAIAAAVDAERERWRHALERVTDALAARLGTNADEWCDVEEARKVLVD